MTENLPNAADSPSGIGAGTSPAIALQASLTRHALMLDLLQRQRRTSDADAMMRAGAEAVGQYLHADRVGFFEMRGDAMEFSVGWTGGRLKLLNGTLPAAAIGTRYLAEVRAGRTLGISDARIDPLTADSEFAGIGAVSLIGVPIIRNGLWHAGFYVNHSEVRHWTDAEVELTRDIGEQTWDAVERTRAVAALRKSEERLTLALEAGGGVGTWDWDVPADLFYCNARFARLYSVDPERAAAGVPLSAFMPAIHPDDRAAVADEVERALKTGEDYALEYRVVQNDGAVRWIYARGRCQLDRSGAPVRFPGVVFDITERKNAEAALRRQWRTFDTALSNTPDFTYTFDLEGRFVYVNRALLSLWQLSYEEAVGKNFFELRYPPELARRLELQIQQVIATGKTLRDQTPFTGPTGETRHYEYIFVPVFAQDGSVEAVAGSTRDVTDRNNAEELIHEDRRRWRDLLFHAPAAIAVLRGAEHRFEWVNPGYARLVGRPAETIVGRTVLETVPETEGPAYVNLLNGVYRTGEPFVGHEALLRLDSGGGTLKTVYVNVVCQVTRDIAGRIDGIFVHAADVTDLVQARQHIEDREQQFRTLAESIPHLAWMAHADGHLFWYNRRWYEYTGTNPREMEGWGWRSVHDPDVLPQVIERWRLSIASGESFEMVFPLRGADGTFRTFLTRGEPVRDSHGRLVRWFGTNTDITDQRRTEEELRRMNRELEEFAYVASHDLQEPLRMVNIYTQLILRMAGQEDANIRSYAGFVREGVSRMQVLIRDLLTFSRAVHEEHVSEGAADLSASLGDAMSVLKTRIDQNEAVITAEPLPLVRGDASQLAHVFQNLLSNALKYRKADVAPVIHILVRQSGGEWIVSVEDNGIGFDPQYAGRIFGLFKRLHKEEYPGTGLGLAICQRIVERYGGRIWAESSPGQGSTFFFALPSAEV